MPRLQYLPRAHWIVATLLLLGCSSEGEQDARPPGPTPGKDASPDAIADASTDAPEDGPLSDASCFPSNCVGLGANCGTATDGCGGTIDCGSCDDGESCGGGGPNVCGATKCEPKTCESLDAECGWVSDGCSSVLNCGGCPPPSVCEGLGHANQCECVATTCEEADAECGTVPDGCGGVIDCGACSTGENCGGDGPNHCGTDSCSPKSCMQLGASCGWISDGCATAIDCGTCEEPNFCGGGGVANECGCLAKSCAQLGASCGMLDTGCGEVDCGACSAPESCGGGGIQNVCGCTCSLPHAITACEAGSCSILQCSPGWADCNGNSTDGCEINLATSVGNCGGCGIACSFPNASAICNGQCLISTCDAFYDDCNGNTADGCETYTKNDASNCGACNNVCSLPHTGQEGCSSGNCVVLTCSSGWGDCDGVDANGCERSLSTMSDCGSCGHDCGDGETCSNGSCRCGSGAACGVGEYCYNGQACYDLPTMTWTPSCMNVGVDHLAPNYLYDFKIYGRPGATAQKYNQQVSCGTAAYAAESFTIGSAGWVGEVLETGAAACIGTLGEWETWAVVDGFETNHVSATFYSSQCAGATTCTQAKSYCVPD